MVKTFSHSVTLDKSKCRGCTTCLKRCPTEAIRIRERRARIIEDKCIDCGECIRACPYHAKVAVTDAFEAISRAKYKIALPAPALYGQFKNLKDISHLLAALKKLGFDMVFEVARGAEYITNALSERLANTDKTLISSACPAIVRLIQVRFPDLIDNIVDLISPMEAAAMIAKKRFAQERGVPMEQIGAFFITPCPAKMTAIRNPLGHMRSAVDGAVSIIEIYGKLNKTLSGPLPDEDLREAAAFGVGWANSGGETLAVGEDSALAVDGIQNVIHVLEEIENDRLTDLRFFEGLACTGGCLGGPLVFDNGFVAKNRLRKLIDRLPKVLPGERVIQGEIDGLSFDMNAPLEPSDAFKLGDSISEALRKMERIDAIEKDLPGLDCGSCGSPTCRTLAEDIVGGYAVELDCIFKLKERVSYLAQQMVDISNTTRN